MSTDVPPGELRGPPVKKFESSRVASTPDGWITTKGVFYPCSSEEHDECARYLLETHESLIASLLVENNHRDMVDRWQNTLSVIKIGRNPRTILNAAGFALLSGNQLSESNLPEALSWRQMEFINRNKLVLTPRSGQLDFEDYRSFQASVADSEEVKRLSKANEAVRDFLADPTKFLSIQDDTPLAKEVFAALTADCTAEIVLKISKGFMTWRQLKIPPNGDVFLQFQHHYHGSDCTPEREDFIDLTRKQSIKKYLLGMGNRTYSSLQGDVGVLYQ